MLHEARANLAFAQTSKTIAVAPPDSGYYSEANLAEEEGPRALHRVVNERGQRRGEASGKGVGRVGAVHVPSSPSRGRRPKASPVLRRGGRNTCPVRGLSEHRNTGVVEAVRRLQIGPFPRPPEGHTNH